jgi:hypothetical protein
LKERLVSRYLFEHLFLAHLYFDSDPEHHYFRLLRSRTPPGQPIDWLPADDRLTTPASSASTIDWSVNRRPSSTRRTCLMRLGAETHGALARTVPEAGLPVDELPSYALEVASNPFLAFRALPVKARYQFMLDEAEFTIMGFIKGPVCRGQVALNVIEDQFWVFFQANTDHEEQQMGRFLEREASLLQLPAELGSDAGIIGPWREYAKREASYLQDKSDFLTRLALTRNPPELASDLEWRGS